MPAPRDHGWWPYLGPYGLFLVLVELGSRVPDEWVGVFRVLRVALPGLWIASAIAQGRLPELRGYRPGASGLLRDVACGLVIAALWMGPYLLVPALPRPGPEEGWSPSYFGPGNEAWAWTLRLVGFAVVTPFIEELFVRSFLLRLVDVIDTGMDFRKVPIARFAWRSFLVTVVWFTFTHVRWEWPVAVVAGVLFNLWLYRRRHIGAVIVAHAAANGAIWLAVALGPDAWRVFL